MYLEEKELINFLSMYFRSRFYLMVKTSNEKKMYFLL